MTRSPGLGHDALSLKSRLLSGIGGRCDVGNVTEEKKPKEKKEREQKKTEVRKRESNDGCRYIPDSHLVIR